MLLNNVSGHVKSSPHEPNENSLAERSVRTVKEAAMAMSRTGHLQPNMWLYAIQAACHVLLFVPLRRFDRKITAFERRFGRAPSVMHLRVLGCETYFYNYEKNRHHFHGDKARRGVLVGYDHLSRCYCVWHLQTQRLVRSSDCIFRENVFPLKSPAARTPMIRSQHELNQVNDIISRSRDQNLHWKRPPLKNLFGCSETAMMRRTRPIN